MKTLLAAAAILIGSGCGGGATPAPLAPPAAPAQAVSAGAALDTASAEVTFAAGERQVPGTIVAPTAPGPWPAVVLLAGSGPTDRDWNSPLLPAKGGSGKLLAEALARRGAVVLRFDKAGTGQNAGPPAASFTLDTYRDEGVAAVAFVRARGDVRADRVFVAGHSEGGIHATRVALAAGADLAGVIYLAATGRTMAKVMLTQLEGNLRNPLAGLSDAQVAAELASLRAAFDAFLASRPVDPRDASAIPQLQQLVAGLVEPSTAALMRGLLGFDTAAEAGKLTVPVLVVNGGKDIQVDPDLDARHLDGALRAAARDTTLVIAPDADHVLKHEPKTLAEIRADLLAAQNRYNAEDRALDPALVGGIVAWLAARTR